MEECCSPRPEQRLDAVMEDEETGEKPSDTNWRHLNHGDELHPNHRSTCGRGGEVNSTGGLFTATSLKEVQKRLQSLDTFEGMKFAEARRKGWSSCVWM